MGAGDGNTGQEGLEWDTSCITTRAGWLVEAGVAEPVAGLQKSGDAADLAPLPGTATSAREQAAGAQHQLQILAGT